MSRVLLAAVPLTAIYLLVLGSVKPGDVAMGAGLSVVVAAALRPLALRPGADDPPRPGLDARLLGVPRLVAAMTVDVLRGSLEVARYALGLRDPANGGYVEVPLAERTRRGTIAWALLSTLSPGEIVVDLDFERGVAVLHVLDARDPDAVRARHQERYERIDRRVVP